MLPYGTTKSGSRRRKGIAVDGTRFDRLARSLAVGHSRRHVLGGLVSLAAALAGRTAVGAACPPGQVRKRDRCLCKKTGRPPVDGACPCPRGQIDTGDGLGCLACRWNDDCTAPQTCGGGGTVNVCGCTPEAASTTCQGTCGTQANNCGRSVDCGPCCIADGGDCLTDVACCSFVCESGVCIDCRTNGGSCAINAQCCSDICTAGFCGECRINSDNCLLNAECCSFICTGGHCGDCRINGDDCGLDSECCSDICSGGSCGDCRINTDDCGLDSECCSDICDNGFCSDCRSNGGACLGNGQCCTDICTGGFCADCRINGNGCQLDAECCSDICTGGFCGNCRIVGDDCLLDAECCSNTCGGSDFCESGP
jgi:hypothetical protein